MEQIGKTAGRSLARLSAHGALPESDSERTLLAWSALVEVYGSAVHREYGETPPRLWREAISSLSDEELRLGFTSLIEEKRQFAPNLTEFVAACRPKTSTVRYLGGPSSQYKRLPQDFKRAAPEVRKRHLENMRKLFR